ncbi:hypothetical protein BJX65DRAFT_311003 [Aspergillus insuetus]
MAVYVCSTKAAVFVNQYVNPIGLENIGWKYYIVYVLIIALESFVAYGWFLETKGKGLEEIAVLFDGEDADHLVKELTTDDKKEVHVVEHEDDHKTKST